MAKPDRTDDPGRRKSVPPPKAEYKDPADEPRSPQTQAAADRWLGGSEPSRGDG